MILSHELLHPVTYQIQDPFASILERLDSWIKENHPAYEEKWAIVKYDYIKRILGLAANGPTLRGHAQTAPSFELNSALFDLYQLLDHCVYFTSRYWRAFYYWLRSEEISPCWPQFTLREAHLAMSLLKEKDLIKLREDAQKEWADLYDNDTIANIFRTIKTPISRLCRKRLAFLGKYDPALYSPADLQQCAYEAILVALRKNDYFTTKPLKITGWALKCADNAIHNLREVALAEKRSRIVESPEQAEIKYDGKYYTHREVSLFTPIVDNGQQTGMTWFDSFCLSDKCVNSTEDSICFQKLLKAADPKINTYLRTVCGGEHNPEFWTWFYYNEPTLAQRVAYIEENPEALGPYLQRHLDLPTYQLMDFLRQHMPDLLSKLSDTPRNRALLAYA